jgi:effector-binding domain-containing protein
VAADIQVKRLPAVLALVASSSADAGTVKERMGEAFGVLMQHVGTTGARIIGPPFTQYQEPVGAQFAFAVCMPVAPGAVPGDGVGVEELPAVEAASFLYTGPYDAMEASWRGLLAWVAENGRQLGGPLREVYLNDPTQVAESDLLTEMLVPLA